MKDPDKAYRNPNIPTSAFSKLGVYPDLHFALSSSRSHRLQWINIVSIINQMHPKIMNL